MKAFWFPGTNVGDTLTPVILRHFTKYRPQWVPSSQPGKLLMCGSILESALPGDTILGAGDYHDPPMNIDKTNVLALRGRLSGEASAYGDPAILLPLMYKPRIRKTRTIGYTPHVWDQQNYKGYIDVNLPWKEFVREILASERVVTSSLHGYIIAHAYGVPVEWVHYEPIPGADLKYYDYLTGVADGIEKSQQDLLKALEQL